MKAITVLGEVAIDRLGVVLPHEHLHTTSSFMCTAGCDRDRTMEEIDPAELRQSPMRFAANLDMRDEHIAGSELGEFRKGGGATLVELTPQEHLLGRDANLLRRLSRASGVNVIMGTGWYVERSHPSDVRMSTVDQLARRMVHEITVGTSDGIRAGVIGEIGTGDPLTAEEERVLRAAALAQLQTGCPINVHTAAGCREVPHILAVLRSTGLHDLSRVVISHMDVVIDLPLQREVAGAGAIIEFDTFGHEAYPDSRGFMMPRDEDRVEALAQLHQWGLMDQVLVSHDVCFRHLWRRYGGKGYTNLLVDAQPLFDRVGLGADVRQQLLVSNPGRVFAFEP